MSGVNQGTSNASSGKHANESPRHQQTFDSSIHPPGRAPTGGQSHVHRPISAMPTPSARSNAHHAHSIDQDGSDEQSFNAAIKNGQADRRASAHPAVPITTAHSNMGMLSSPISPMDTITSNAIGQGIPTTSPAAMQYFAAHPRRQQVHFGNYLLLQTLGEGEFGKVKLGVHKEWGEEVAVKLIKRDKVGTSDGQLQITGPSKDPAKMSKVEKEIRVLKDVRHPNIVRLYEVIESDRYIGIVLEYASGGELFDHILAHKYLKDRDACRLFAQLISGVSYLHQKKIVHRDLKLENLLLDRNRNVIITDFGFANNFENKNDDLMATSCGSPCYAAPELVVQDGLYAGSAVDVWSCGVILYAMLAGYLPFDDDPANPDGDNINLLYKYIMATPLSFPDYIGPQPRDLLCRMLVPDPLKRTTLAGVMAHPWLSPYRDLFKFSVEELERAAIEQQNKKRQVYRQQMIMQQQMQEQQRRGGAVNVNDPSRGIQGQSSTDKQAYTKQQRHQSAAPTTSFLPDRVQQESATSRSRPVTGMPTPRSEQDKVQYQPGKPIVSAQVPDSQYNQPTRSHDSNQVAQHREPSHDGSSAVSKRSAASKTQRHTVQLEYVGSNASATHINDRNTARGTSTQKNSSVQSTPHKDNSITSVKDTQEIAPTPLRADERNGTRYIHGQETSDSVNVRKKDDQVLSTSTRQNIPSEEGTPKANAEKAPQRAPSNPLPHIEVSGHSPVKSDVHQERRVFSDGHATSASQISNGKSTASPQKEKEDKSQARHRKGMSTDKFFLTKLLGPQGVPSSLNEPLQQSRQVESKDKAIPSKNSVPPTPETGKESILNSTTIPGTPAEREDNTGRKTSSHRRKAMSLVVGRPLDSQAKDSEKSEKSSRRLTARLRKESSPSGTSSQRRPHTPKRIQSTASGDQSIASSKPSPSTASVITSHTSTSQRAPSSIFKRSNNASNAPFEQSLNESSSTVGASSNAAKKVMDWFRKKSMSKSQLEDIPPFTSFESPSVASPSQRTRKQSTSVALSNANEAKSQTRSASGKANAINEKSTNNPQVVVTDDHVQEGRPEMDSVPSSRSTSGTQSHVSQTTQSTGATSATEGSRVRKEANIPQMPGSKSSDSTMQQQATPRASSSIVNQLNANQNVQSDVGGQTSTANTKKVANLESAIRVHQGAVDQSALTSRSPDEVIKQVQRALWLMGIEAKKDNEEEYKMECIRRRRNKTLLGAATQNLGLSIRTSVFPPSQADYERSSNTASDQLNKSSTLSPSQSSMRNFLRRGSSQHNGQLITQSSTANEINTSEDQLPPPLYGEPSVDGGQEVRFSVEMTRLKNLPGLYSVDIRRMKGNLWAYKFIYHALLDRCDLSGTSAPTTRS
jgi:protein-serine/threonine kinase